MAGTGLYATKAIPLHNDDTQSGAPGGQVITLITGGLGVLDAWKGGYVVNATRAETRSIVSHTDMTVTLEGSLVNWLNTDDLDIYDSWGTIQAAADRLFVDQGAVTFVASQYVHVYTGTYAETVTPHATLDPDELNGYLLVIEGDPDVSRANIIIAPAAGTYTVFINCDQCLLRHFTITHPVHGVRADSGNAMLEIADCAISGLATGQTIWAWSGLRVRDSDLGAATHDKGMGGYYGLQQYDRCTLRAGSATVEPVCSPNREGLILRSCVIIGTGASRPGVQFENHSLSNRSIILNCTFYDCAVGIKAKRALDDLRIANNVFLNCARIIEVAADAWPEETITRIGPRIVLRNNCFSGHTSVLWDGTDGKTYAETAAYGLVDAVDNIETDPLLTDPAAGDFSLQAASPCRSRGAGAGVIESLNAVDFDPYHPDIGAWSSGGNMAPHYKQHSLHDTDNHTDIEDLDRDITWDLYRDGAVLSTGAYTGVVEVPFACTITIARLFADQTGNLVIDVWRTTYADYVPGSHPVDADSIVAAAPPTLTAASKSEDAVLTGWTVTLAKGDLLAINVDSVDTITWARLVLHVVPV